MNTARHVIETVLVLALAGALKAGYDWISGLTHRRYQRLKDERAAVARAGVASMPPSPQRDRILDLISHQPGEWQRTKIQRIVGAELRSDAEKAAAKWKRQRRHLRRHWWLA